MDLTQKAFADLLYDNHAIQFGEFKLKSGRISPFYFDISKITDGKGLSDLGYFYAKKLVDLDIDFDNINGPPYRGIPLVVITATALYDNFKISKSYSTYRKEEKDYGAKGLIVGAVPHPGDSVIVLDDVFTTGETKEETINLLRNYDVKIPCVLTGINRHERGVQKNAAEEFFEKTGVPVHSILNLEEIIKYFQKPINGKPPIDRKTAGLIEQYTQQYCI